ncbi:MAG: carboxypeptidase-like regulatory domain-containing protein, partial [Ilumatobacteraceae bacterium]
MTVRVDIDTSRLDAAPGDIVNLPVRLTNTADAPASCRVSVVGLGDTEPDGVDGPAGYDVIVPAGGTLELLAPVAVPWTLGIGDHTAAIEIISDRPGDRPILTSFVISIGSVARVELVPLPSTMRGRRRAKFKLDIVNNEVVPVDLAISAEAADVEITFRDPAVRLQPGERMLTTAQVRGPRHWSGESTQHNLVITATGRASSTSTTAAYIQRPLFAHRARMVLAAVTVVALWLGAIGGVALWWSNRADDQLADDATFEVVGVDTDGDGVLDQFTDADGNVITGIDTDGDGETDAFFDSSGAPVPDPRGDGGGGGDSGGESGGDGESGGSGGSGDGETADGAGSGSTATSALLRGTVKADGDPSDVTITLTPIALGATPATSAAIQGFVGPQNPEAAKIWSARILPPGSATLNPIRQTEPLAPLETNPESDGVWQIPDVQLRRSYEIVFAKPGFDTQSFVVTPPEDGSPLELDVELVPATGAISGTVRGPSGALGGAEIIVTDGVLSFTTTSATVGAVGTWAVDQVSTPGVYTVSATLRGYGTEVRQVTLKAGETFSGADLNMEVGVGSVSGRIVGPDGQPLGGVSITATNGDESRTTSSLTEGDIGSYNIPQLSVGGTFTLLVTAPGYISESRRTPVNGAVGGVDFGMTKTTLTLTGTVTSGTSGIGVANAGLTLTTGDLTFRASTVGGANRGQFAIADLPPGSYTVTVDHYQHVPSTQLVVLTAGVPPPPLDIALERGSGLPALGTGSLVVEVVDPSAKTTETRQIKNATVRLIRTQTGQELPPITQEAYNFRIDNIPIGTYTVLVTAPRYNPAPARQVSIG